MATTVLYEPEQFERLIDEPWVPARSSIVRSLSRLAKSR